MLHTGAGTDVQFLGFFFVMILIDNSFAASETKCYIFLNEMETVWCTYKLGGEIFLFGVAYRPQTVLINTVKNFFFKLM